MQYHAKSLMENGFDVDILGYTGTPLIGPLLNAEANGRLSQHLVSPPRKLDSTRGGRLVYLLSGAVRVASQLLQLAYVMLYEVPSPEAILTQTPPAIPTLVLVGLAARLRASRLVVDWHNFGYSLMALHLGPNSPIVRIAEAYELIVGQWAASGANLAVTEAMSAFLRKNMGCTAPVITFHDRPPALFSRLNAEARTQFLGRLELPLPLNKGTSGKAANQLLADHSNPSRPVLLVSSTSWTADEDFGLLLEALKEYEDRAPSSAAKLEVIVTGRGPMKSMYERQMAELTMKRVNIRTAWLEPEDYPLLLGVADLGISLHTSSSGVDLPMKAVDMFGAGLPVAALRYPVMEAEMVREGEEGLLFDREGSATLANRLIVGRRLFI